MLRRSFNTSNNITIAAVVSSCFSTTTSTTIRHSSSHGWRTQNSTRDIRSREQRDQERRLRQLDKLPRPELLHDFQYPFEKRVLCDSWFQPPVYNNELDTPRLFNHYPPNDFFVYFNASDFQRTQYPPVPDVDFRKLSSSSNSDSSNNVKNSSLEWKKQCLLANQYLRKHEVVPNFVPNVDHSVNMSVVFGTSSTDRDELNRDNFWKTSLYGNFMELKESHFVKEVEKEDDNNAADEEDNNNKKKKKQKGVSRFANSKDQPVPVRDESATPSIFLSTPPQPSSSSTQKQNQEQLYTLLIVSPDYPCRAEPNDTFFLHYAVCNLKPSPSSSSSSQQQPIDVMNKEVVSYVPPLPTEDAGSARVMCVLFPQEKEFDTASRSKTTAELPFEKRCMFRLHSSHSSSNSNSNSNSQQQQHPIFQLEQLINPTTASACTFFQTSWDIQTQEWYESNSLPEPRYYPQDIVDLVEMNALPSDFTQVSSRHNAYGGIHEDDVLEQTDKYLVGQHSATRGMSRHTLLSKDGKKIIRPYQRL